MATVHTRIEKKRGCGYRKGGGMYLVSGRLMNPCGKLPVPLCSCKFCGAGIKQSRGFTWINSSLFVDEICLSDTLDSKCNKCISMCTPNVKMGLMWIGKKFYATPDKFLVEANIQGLSKRIGQIPRELVVGETMICLGHPEAIRSPTKDDVECIIPGIFAVFVPQAIEYVVTGTETPEELDSLEKRGFTLIKVVRDIDTQNKMEV